jgi:hypothetical protein
MDSHRITRRITKTACELTLALACIPFFVLGGVPRKEIELRIKKFDPAPHGFAILVSVKNVGERPLVLAKTGSPLEFGRYDVLQSLDIQQWDEKLGWQHVGPCHDIAPMATVTVAPGRTIEDVITISDKAHGWGGAPCPVRIAHLGGRVRAILGYAYGSELEFQERKASHEGIISPYVEIPTMKD